MENEERKLTKPVQALLRRLVESDVDTAALSASNNQTWPSTSLGVIGYRGISVLGDPRDCLART
jgi:hypothetical protein